MRLHRRRLAEVLTTSTLVRQKAVVPPQRRYNFIVMSAKFRFTPDRAVLAGLLLTAAVYCRDLRYDFILDDVPLILMNPTIGSWRNWKTVFRTDIFFASGSGLPIGVSAIHYRPIYVLWLMLNQQLFGSVLPWWHLTSLFLHLAVTCLVYRLALQLLRDGWTAALAALLFAFHPIHVESVSYVTASTDLLAALFVLLAFFGYSRFREQGASPAFLIASLFAASLAMLSKETAVMLPWILVAYEALRETPPGGTARWKGFIWTIPFFGIVGAYLAIRTVLFGMNAGPGPGGSRFAASLDIPLVLISYLRMLVWPFRLSFFYPVEWGTQWTLLKGTGVALVVVTALLAYRHYRTRPAVRLQLLWTAIFVIPALLGVFTFVKEDWLHDRHMYLVSVPFCLIVAVVLRDLKLPGKRLAVLGAFVVAMLLIETAVQVPRFRDNLTIYASTLRVAPDNVLARTNYALALWGLGHREQSLDEFRMTTERWPRSAQMHDFYAGELAESGRDEEATLEYANALRWTAGETPFRASILYKLANIEVKHSQSEQGAAHMREALRIAPQTLNYHAVMAEALREQGRTQEADDEMLQEAATRQSWGTAAKPPRK